MNTKISIKELRNIPQNEPFICLFSGGKDCGLALSIAFQTGQPIAIIHVVENDSKSVFHGQDKSIIEQQAACIDLPLIYLKNDDNFKLSQLKIYMKYIKEGVKSIVMGTLFDDDLEANLDACEKMGISMRMPLWDLPYETLLFEMEKRGIEGIITAIDDTKIPPDFLGMKFDRDIYNTFLKLGIDPFGENGEFHTTLVNADYFKKPFQYKIIGKSKSLIELQVT